MLLTREQILQADDLKTEDVQVPEWGGAVRVRALSGDQRDAYEAAILIDRDDGKGGTTVDVRRERLRATLASMSIVDEAGQPMFTEQDIAALGKKSARALARVVEAAQRLSGLTKKDMEELEKNSGGGQNDDSGSS